MCGLSRLVIKKRKDSDGTTPYILTANKGVCSACEAAVWVLAESNLQIKLCQQCCHFRPLAFFAGKQAHKTHSLVTSCVHCRARKQKRAKKRKETARRLKEKSSGESGGVVAATGAENSSVLGKRQSIEASSASTESTSKRLKMVTPVEPKKDVERKAAARESSALTTETEFSSKGSTLPVASPAMVQPKAMTTIPLTTKEEGRATAAAQNSAGIQPARRTEVKEVDTLQQIPSAASSQVTTLAARIAPSTRNRCVPLSSSEDSE